MKPFEATAVTFAQALVDDDCKKAFALLHPNLQRDSSPEHLKEQLFSMFRRYAKSDPNSIHLGDEFSTEDNPFRQNGDVGWAYVSISGDDFCEAVAVTVTEVEGTLLIRDIEWGRP